jgi:DNA-directed RNA polymerase subunit RPC12/RpoP
MAEKITVYQCPACTGPLHFDGKIGKLKCDYCGSAYTTEEMEALYKDKNENAVKSDQEAQKKADAAEEKAAKEAAEAGMSQEEAGGWGSDAAHMRAYNCTNCGAELICDETTAATSCPYCGSPTVIPSKFAGVDRPDYLIPFKVDKKQAISAFKEYYKGRKLLPRSFESDNHIEEIKGVYVPFWMFSGTVEGAADYDARKEDRRRAGDEEIVRTEYFDVHREGTMRFEKIPVDASTKMPDDLMDSIEPFDYKELRPFAMEYMPGYLANKYDVDRKESRARASERATSTFRSALQNTVKGYSSVSVKDHHEKTTPEKTEYGMLPVWMLSSNWEGKTYLFAMNGQSGKMIGDLPVSKAKLAAWVIGVFAAVFAIFHFLLLKQQGDSLLISGAVAFIVAAITGAVMNSSMKPVAKSHSASGYVADEGSLRLRAQADRFVRTMETRHKIKQGGSGKPGGAGSGGPGGSGGHGGPAGPGGPGGRAGGPKGGHR